MNKIHPKDKYAAFPRKLKTKKSSLVKTLDRWFSKYIRYRDRIDATHCRCVTCGAIVKMKGIRDGNVIVAGAHAGHFADRTYHKTRWNEKNVHVQCSSCNNWHEGKQYEMGKYINKKYGEGTAEELIKLSKLQFKYEKFQLIQMIEFYKKLVKQYERG